MLYEVVETIIVNNEIIHTGSIIELNDTEAAIHMGRIIPLKEVKKKTSWKQYFNTKKWL